MRGTSVDDLRLIARVTRPLEYVDRTVSRKVDYYYALRAENPLGEGPLCDPVEIVLRAVPGPVSDLRLSAGDGFVHLHWSPPMDDGGSPIFKYVVMKTVPGGVYPISTDIGMELDLNDTLVDNGLEYSYTVAAVNAIGQGPEAPPVTAHPLGGVGPVSEFNVSVQGKAITLTWVPPSEEGRQPVTGYRLSRGTTPDQLAEIATLGPVTGYIDEGIERGPTYYYRLVPMSGGDEGPSSTTSIDSSKRTTGTSSAPIAMMVMAILLLLVMSVGYVVFRRGRAGAEGLPSGTTLGPGAFEDGTDTSGHVVEEVFVVYSDGRLIAHATREDFDLADLELMSGMLIAIQGLIQDGLERGGALRSIKYAEIRIVLGMGKNLVLAAVVYGKPDTRLQEMFDTTLLTIEDRYSDIIEGWDGDLSGFEGIEDIIRNLVDSTADLSRDDVGKVASSEGVSIVSAVDFHRGYVRLKMNVQNGMDEYVADATLEMRYNRDMLRLERVEPDHYRLVGDTVSMGNISPGEMVTAALLFDPQICQGTQIDGSLMFYDPKGKIKRVEMKRRNADVVCPIFFTEEHINTAMLRRLIKDKLHQSEFRTFRYPRDIGPARVYELGKVALGGGSIQLVREFIDQGPPYEAEAWYYGKTRVKGYQMVMRIEVIEEKGLLVFFAASTDMQPVTGLLAEFRREVERAVQESYPETPSMATEDDEDLRTELDGRKLLIEKREDEWETTFQELEQ
jgi:hypothetical protein